MNKINVFCFGYGQVAKSFIKKLRLENFDINLSTTSRNKTHINKFDRLTYDSFQFDGDYFDNKLIEKLDKSDHILVSIPPRNRTDLVIKNFSSIIKNSNAKWITYLSSTSVYGNHKGGWVNEKSETRPVSRNGIDRLSAEKLWFSLYSNNRMPLQIFRLSGIYSNKNNILVRLKNRTAKIVNKKNSFFSRIHVDDIANILFESLSKFKSGEIYNISDDKPSSSEEVTLYSVKLLNIDKPKIIEVKDIESKMLKNFYKDSKKVSNNKMKKFFKYDLKFPSYIEGLKYISNNFI